MKIKFDIQEKYKEAEIHLCNKEKSPELMEVHKTLENLLDTRIKVQKGQESRVVVPSQIIRIYSESKKVFIRTKDDCYEVKERLYTLEELLKDRGFVRISNSEIVSIQQIEKLDMSHVGTIKMYMRNQDETYVSRRYVSKIKEVLL
ncbi:MAG: LytTR family transcriptional regulator [Lachnospiraceae bacterium]|nr:LytTR family transcriptional regulator [Lachnospiraceae bacterium]